MRVWKRSLMWVENRRRDLEVGGRIREWERCRGRWEVSLRG